MDLLRHCGCSPAKPRRHGDLADCQWHRRLGTQQQRGLGLRYHELRILDRYRSRRNAHLGDSAAVSPAVENLDQPLRRSHDHLRGHVRRHVSRDTHGASLGCVLYLPLSESARALMGQLPLPPGLGRGGHQHILDRVALLLVPGDDSRSGHLTRSCKERHQEDDLPRPELGMERIASHLVAL